VMRVRGFLFLLAAPAFWFFYVRAFEGMRKGPFGYEVGSVAAPIPSLLQVVGITAVLCTWIGLALVIFDLVKWRKTRSR
jgi:hypothetical protein